jgi:hypothetical protein
VSSNYLKKFASEKIGCNKIFHIDVLYGISTPPIQHSETQHSKYGCAKACPSCNNFPSQLITSASSLHLLSPILYRHLHPGAGDTLFLTALGHSSDPTPSVLV